MSVDTSTGVLRIDGVRLSLSDLKKMLVPGRKLFRPFIEDGELRLIEFDERHAIWFDEEERLREE
jgi:hypothetical protein